MNGPDLKEKPGLVSQWDWVSSFSTMEMALDWKTPESDLI